ncbi:unnamed protein product [Spirodela intermedia]|uniref:Dihydrolipoamide acetyltransferase component of pyruvate dehydrogenase complex n=1 Tax=Spirodela intermedia TaxID=51605 RepID=A0A7I8J501_SPIIN|nr:unnamed protein product [Spirodela intermedia]CAA6664845.1 unnamed protein product [Spirodela intermedia]
MHEPHPVSSPQRHLLPRVLRLPTPSSSYGVFPRPLHRRRRLGNGRRPLVSFSSSLSSSAAPLLRRRAAAAVPLLRPRSRRSPSKICAKIREIFMPALSSTMTEGKIVSWVNVVVVESDKADMDVETFYDGILAAIVVSEGQSAPVGAPIGLLAETEEEIAEAPVAAPPVQAIEKPAVAAGPKSTVLTPYAKKLAKQYKVDVASIVGTGPFFTSSISPAVVATAAAVAPAPKAAPPAAPAPPIPGATVVPFTTMQAAVSKNMVESLSVPTFRVGYPVKTDALDALYEKVKPKGVTMTVLLAKAAAMALAQHPVVNSTCKDGKSFTYNSSINIAVAVAIDGGLITPVLQDADKFDIYLLSQRWKELVGKARAKQLQPSEYNSGTFTLSNLGMFGVDRFDAILPPGQGAIMAVGASKPTVVADADGFFSVKNKMLVNVTADHRIIYGADLAAFLQAFAKIVENPDSLTL